MPNNQPVYQQGFWKTGMLLFSEIWKAGLKNGKTGTGMIWGLLQVENIPVPAGEYGLFFVINGDNSGELILSKDSRSWGSFFYDPKQDLLRANIKLQAIPFTDILTYDFIHISKTSAELVLTWEKKQFPVRIELDVDKIVMANAAEELKGPVGFTWQGFSGAANYALQNKTNLDRHSYGSIMLLHKIKASPQ